MGDLIEFPLPAAEPPRADTVMALRWQANILLNLAASLENAQLRGCKVTHQGEVYLVYGHNRVEVESDLTVNVET